MAKDFGTRVRLLRLERNLSQENVAEALGIQYSTVGKKEANKSEFTITEVKSLAKLFKMSVAELIGEKPMQELREEKKTIMIPIQIDAKDFEELMRKVK